LSEGERPLKLWIDPDGVVWVEDPDGRARPWLEALEPGHAFAPPTGAHPPPTWPTMRDWPVRPPHSLAEAWRSHAKAMEAWGRGAAPPTAEAGDTQLLALKVHLAQALGRACAWCGHRCGVDRLGGQLGWCQAGREALVGEAYLHEAEEREIAPSFLLAMTGCSWRCRYCHVPELVHAPSRGRALLGPAAGPWRQLLEASQANTLSFVGGNPDQHLAGILGWLAQEAEGWRWPVVWNSNLSATPEGLALLEGLVAWHVADLRYGSEACAIAGSKTSLAHWQPRSTLQRWRSHPPLGAEIVVRLLALPGHLECCLKANLDWLAEQEAPWRVHLMTHYHPAFAAQANEAWGRVLLPEEKALAEAWLQASGLRRVAAVELR
jgi:putative pyruvate formate lyase activating enzyme